MFACITYQKVVSSMLDRLDANTREKYFSKTIDLINLIAILETFNLKEIVKELSDTLTSHRLSVRNNILLE